MLGPVEILKSWFALSQLRQRRRLIFDRDVRQEILIDNKILITIEGRRGSGVAVSIRAPREIPVVRAEVVEREFNEIKDREEAMALDPMGRMVGAAISAANSTR